MHRKYICAALKILWKTKSLTDKKEGWLQMKQKVKI